MSDQRTVLVVEDDVVFRRVLGYTIKKAGFVVESFGNGALAYDRLIQGNVDCLVTDLQMPVCDGVTLLKRLTETEGYSRPPAILCTAKGLELDSQELIQRFQLSAVMHKPFSPRKLLMMIEEFCRVPAATSSES